MVLSQQIRCTLERRIMINSRGKRVVREVVFLTTFVFVRVEDKNLNEIRNICGATKEIKMVKLEFFKK